jgi:hypothetical protein
MAIANIYTASFSKLATWLTPVPLRQPKLLAFVKALIDGSIGAVYNRFIIYANTVDYNLYINSQVCFMEKALNDKYDIADRGIYITDGEAFDAVPLYLKAENKFIVQNLKADGPEVVLYTKAETAAFTTDFVVYVPVTLTVDFTELSVFVSSIKLPSKTFALKTY